MVYTTQSKNLHKVSLYSNKIYRHSENRVSFIKSGAKTSSPMTLTMTTLSKSCWEVVPRQNIWKNDTNQNGASLAVVCGVTSNTQFCRMSLCWMSFFGMQLCLMTFCSMQFCWTSFCNMLFCWMSFCWMSFCWMPFCWMPFCWMPFCWMSFCWMSFCWMLFCWMSFCWMSLCWMSFFLSHSEERSCAECCSAEPHSDVCYSA